MPDLQKLQQKYAEQMRTDFSNPVISPYPQEWQTGISLLFEFAQTHHSLAVNLFASLQEVLVDKLNDYNALVVFSNYLEKYLSHIAVCTEQSEQADTLGKIIKVLDLLPNDFRFGYKFERQDIAPFAQQPFTALILTAYCTRNEITHADSNRVMPSWSADDLSIIKNRNSALALLLYATLKHRDALQTYIKQHRLRQEPEFVPYLQWVTERFARWQKRFVALQGNEKIELYAREELEDEARLARHGSIAELRREMDEKQFMLLGEAGMGKTTTLQYMAWEDAQACLLDPLTHRLPVYLELKLLSGGRKVLDKILETLKFDPALSLRLLQECRLSLFLDGLNEVPRQERERVNNEIQNILRDYPTLPVIVAGRVSQRFELHDGKRLPVFALQRMNDAQLQEFLAKNSRPSVRALLEEDMQDEDNTLREWLRIPMLFMMLLEVAFSVCKQHPATALEKFRERTENKSLLVQTFVHEIYRRESDRDPRFSDVAFDTLLTDLAVKIFEVCESSAALSWRPVIETLTPRQTAFPDTDLAYFLDVSVQLGILAREESLYSFAHEEYFDYFASLGM